MILKFQALVVHYYIFYFSQPVFSLSSLQLLSKVLPIGQYSSYFNITTNLDYLAYPYYSNYSCKKKIYFLLLRKNLWSEFDLLELHLLLLFTPRQHFDRNISPIHHENCYFIFDSSPKSVPLNFNCESPRFLKQSFWLILAYAL